MAGNTPVATTYTPNPLYAKYLKGACHCGNTPCTCQHEEHEDKCEDCGCCPAGLVEINDADGDVVGCMTPNDAELYYRNIYKCPDGYVKAFDVNGNFQGCLTVTDYKVLYP